ncbi:MAG: hypothetical protein ABH827_00825 [bacterium]
MKKLLRVLVFLLVPLVTDLFSDINFGNRNSAIKVSSGTFNIACPGLSFDGTLVQSGSGAITGNTFEFNEGVLESAGSQALMTAQYDPTGDDTVTLNGSGYLRFEPGTLAKQVYISGTGNKIEGQPTFSSALNLANSSTALTLGIQSALNKDINLNSGTLTLSDNLNLSDDVQIKGPGIIDLNQQQLSLGGYYASSNSWDTDVTFVGATDVVLNGNIALTGAWTFNGKSVINGRGAILDLSDGGSITVSGATGALYLNDVYIKGLADAVSKGKIIFDTAGGKIYLNNVTLDLDGNVTTLVGNYIIDGCTTILLKDNNWTFAGTSLLSVNDRLWLDVYRGAGQIKAPNPLFVGHVLSNANVLANEAAGFLAIGPDGIIKEVGDKSSGGNSSSGALVDQPLVANTQLTSNADIAPGQTITIENNITIDGGGTVVTFADQPEPQFIVSPGDSVLLENITFSRINANTFSMGKGSQIQIGQDVTFELSQELTLTNGKLVIAGTDNIFTVCGLSGKQKMVLSPADGVSKLMDLGGGTLVLQNVEFDGLEFITHDDSASLLIGGNATVPVSQDTSINFDIEGINNELIFLNDAITLSGAISFFGNAATNQLIMRFSLIDPISYDVVTVGDRAGVKAGNPLIIFDGDTGIYLTSDTGTLGLERLSTAGLIFPDPSISIRNTNANAFIVDKNSFLDVQEFEVLDYPIKQQSAQFRLSAEKITGQGLDPSFIRMRRSKKNEKFAVTAYAKKVVKQAQELAKLNKYKIKINPIKNTKSEQKQIQKTDKKLVQKISKNKKHKMLRGLPVLLEDLEDLEDLDKVDLNQRDIDLNGLDEAFVLASRALVLPAAFDTTYRKDVRFDKYVKGNIELDGAKATNFMNEYTIDALGESVIGGSAFNLTLKNGAVLEQAFTQDVRLAPNQYINIDKADRKVITLKVSRLFEVNDNFRVAPGAELIVEFVKSGVADTPVFRFASATQLDLEANAVIRFRGTGIIEFADGAVINMKGNKVEDGVVQGRKMFTITDRASFDIGPDVQLRVLDTGKAFITGVGQLVCAGNIEPASGGLHLWPCDSDDIIVFLQAGAIWRIGSGSSVTTGLGTGNFTFESGSTLQVLDGEFSVNDKSELPVLRSLGDQLTRGYIESAIFKTGSKLIVGKNGKISWGINEVHSARLKTEVKTSFQGPVIEAESGATFEFVSRPVSQDVSGYYQGIEAAQIQNKSIPFTSSSSVYALDIAKYFININSNLTNGSIEYTLPGSVSRKIRTVKGVIVDLLATDVIEQDRVIVSATGAQKIVIDAHRKNGSHFTINQDGTIS